MRPKLIVCKKKVRVNLDCVGARTCLEHSTEGTGSEGWGGATLEVLGEAGSQRALEVGFGHWI